MTDLIAPLGSAFERYRCELMMNAVRSVRPRRNRLYEFARHLGNALRVLVGSNGGVKCAQQLLFNPRVRANEQAEQISQQHIVHAAEVKGGFDFSYQFSGDLPLRGHRFLPARFNVAFRVDAFNRNLSQAIGTKHS